MVETLPLLVTAVIAGLIGGLIGALIAIALVILFRRLQAQKEEA